MLKIAIIDPMGVVYDGNTLSERGLGGSESAVISMARELAKLKFDVTVFNSCKEQNVFDDVSYAPIEWLDTWEQRFDIGIFVRSALSASKHWQLFNHRILWMHDTFCDGDQILESLVVDGCINEVFTLSDFHTSYVGTCDHGGKRMFEVLKPYIWQTRNGINPYYKFTDISKKDPNLFVYNASVTKGMIPLVEDIWPKVKQRIPEAKLIVIGGYYRLTSPDEQELRLRKFMAENKDTSITFTDVIKQAEIADILQKASFMIYPPAFPETFGISSLESLYYNTPIITANFGSLAETAIQSACYKMDYPIEPNSLFPNISKEKQIEIFVDMVYHAHADKYLWQQKANACGIVKDVAEWSTVAKQWEQHFYRKLGMYLPLVKQRESNKINKRVKEIFGRSFSNVEDNDVPRNPEKKLRVIVTVKNAEKYISKCLESIYSQDYENYQLYIVNDYSTDGTRDAIDLVNYRFSRNKALVGNNTKSVGALQNQINMIKWGYPDLDEIVVLIDGDDWLVNDPYIFQRINNLYHEGYDMTYGSCFSLADNIPLVAQDYPPEALYKRTFKQHKFPWIMPYTHLRTFKMALFDKIDLEKLKDAEGNYYKAGGDLALFYELLKEACPSRIKAVKDVWYMYNDLNPLNDYKMNREEQDRNKERIMSDVADSGQVNDISNDLNNWNQYIHQGAAVDNFQNVTDGQMFFQVEKSDVPLNVGQPNDYLLPKPEKKKILIAIPTDKNIQPETFKAIYDLIIPEGYEADFQFFYGYQIDQIRNLIADWVVKGPYDYLFSVDHDIAFPPDTLIKLISAIFLDGNVGIASGVYRQRTENQVLEVYDNFYQHITKENLFSAAFNPTKVGAVGMGCALIKKEVFESIGYPQYVYKSAIDHKDTFSEDVYFCKKAREKGYAVVVDRTILCDHYGQRVFKVC